MWSRMSLAQRFTVTSLLIMLAAMMIVGTWVSQQIREGVITQTAVVTAGYVDTIISPLLQASSDGKQIAPEAITTLGELIESRSLGSQLVSMKLWAPDGRILYSPSPELINQSFAISENLGRALQGEIRTELSELNDPEQTYERRFGDQLLETYAPVRSSETGEILAVSEFYLSPEALDREIREAQLRSWQLVILSTLGMFLLLAGIVGQGSRTIEKQKRELEEKVAQQERLIGQNNALHRRVQRAAANTTALNEQFLHQISADLHDGPGQDLALALLRIEALANRCNRYHFEENDQSLIDHDFDTVQNALKSAMQELRSISAGLRLPDIAHLTPREIILRAIRDCERKTSCKVALKLEEVPEEAPLPVKITLYRLLQEALANSARHADCLDPQVSVRLDGSGLAVQISDRGAGFDLEQLGDARGLGLSGMRERAEVLGGWLAVSSEIGLGTVIQAVLPIDIPEPDYA